jgi:hypothetical protein
VRPLRSPAWDQAKCSVPRTIVAPGTGVGPGAGDPPPQPAWISATRAIAGQKRARSAFAGFSTGVTIARSHARSSNFAFAPSCRGANFEL